METIAKITSGSTAVLLVAVMIMAAGLTGQKNVYACSESNLAMICDSLSKVNLEGMQTRCYFINDKNISTYKTCSTGWMKFENKESTIIENSTIKDYTCDNSTLIKECKKESGELILRVGYG